MKEDKKPENISEKVELSDYVKELIKPENIVGPFDSTEEMLKSLWDED